MVRWMHIAESPAGTSDVSLSDLVGTSSGVPLDALARYSLKSGGFPDDGRRLPDLTLDGVEFFRVAGTEPDGSYVEEIGADHLGDLVTVRFFFDADVSRTERQELIESVYASLEWA
jgi:hypothetical protein